MNTSRLAGLLLLTAGGLWAPPTRCACPEADSTIELTERALTHGDLASIPAWIERTEAAFACTEGVADRHQLARWYRVQAAWLSLSEAKLEAELAWRSAERAEPGGWTPLLGPVLEKERDRVLQTPAPLGQGTIVFDPPIDGLATAINGSIQPFPVAAPPGLHLIQVLNPTTNEVQFARQVFLLDAAEVFSLHADLDALSVSQDSLAPPPPPTFRQVEHDTIAPPPRALWIASGCALTALTLGALARTERAAMTEAETRDALDAAWTRQRIYGWSAYALGAGAVVAVSIHLRR